MKEGENDTCTYHERPARPARYGHQARRQRQRRHKVAGDFTLHVTGGNPSPASRRRRVAGTTYSLDGRHVRREREPPADRLHPDGFTATASSTASRRPERDLHDHQQRHSAEAAPAQGGGQRQRWRRRLARLHAHRRRHGRPTTSGATPVDSGPVCRPTPGRCRRRPPPATRRATGCASVAPGTTPPTSPSAYGGEATCTITNNDIAPELHCARW